MSAEPSSLVSVHKLYRYSIDHPARLVKHFGAIFLVRFRLKPRARCRVIERISGYGSRYGCWFWRHLPRRASDSRPWNRRFTGIEADFVAALRRDGQDCASHLAGHRAEIGWSKNIQDCKRLNSGLKSRNGNCVFVVYRIYIRSARERRMVNT